MCGMQPELMSASSQGDKFNAATLSFTTHKSPTTDFSSCRGRDHTPDSSSKPQSINPRIGVHLWAQAG
jgi:hypothetical protein